jgi:hypothetical protein
VSCKYVVGELNAMSDCYSPAGISEAGVAGSNPHITIEIGLGVIYNVSRNVSRTAPPRGDANEG